MSEYAVLSDIKFDCNLASRYTNPGKHQSREELLDKDRSFPFGESIYSPNLMSAREIIVVLHALISLDSITSSNLPLEG